MNIITVTLYYKKIKSLEGYLIGTIKEYPFIICKGKDVNSLIKQCEIYLNNYLNFVEQNKLPQHKNIFYMERHKEEDGWMDQEITINRLR
jgi:hypothetical protein